jgi:hypothetical protein
MVSLRVFPCLLWLPTGARLIFVQRFFSMFPLGTAGIALLCLRFCVASTLMMSAFQHGHLVVPGWACGLMAPVAVALCIGAYTPVSCTLTVVFQIVVASYTKSTQVSSVVVNILVAASLAALGPGAYSMDAKIFGFRRVLPNTKKSSSIN